MDSTALQPQPTLRHEVVFNLGQGLAPHERTFIPSRSTHHIEEIPHNVDCFSIRDVLAHEMVVDGQVTYRYDEPTNEARIIICREFDQIGLLIANGWWELPRHDAIQRAGFELLSHQDFNVRSLTSIEALAARRG